MLIFFVKSLSHKKMEPQFDLDFCVCVEIQGYFPSRKEQEIKEEYLEIYFKINNVSKLISETFYKIKFI